MTDKMTEIASKSLGDSTSYAVYTDKFDPTLLNPMPRRIAREGYGINGDEFKGFDAWTSHESTFLLDNGLPVAGTLKFVYGAESDLMVESKSAKLYLNSFDMCKMGGTEETAISNYEAQVQKDLENVLQTPVQVKFYSSDAWIAATHFNPIRDYVNLVGPEGISRKTLESMVFDDYEGKKNHIEAMDVGLPVSQKWYTNALRSRCRHTKQKDTGLAAISSQGVTLINPTSILRQVVSLREVNEFHEFCAEKLFVEIASKLKPTDDLSIMLLYSRRGSLDINPVRYRGDITGELSQQSKAFYLADKVQGQ